MSFTLQSFPNCYVDESIHDAHGFAVTAMVFANSSFEERVAEVLQGAGLDLPREEFKSSARMVKDPRMVAARDSLMTLLNRPRF